MARWGRVLAGVAALAVGAAAVWALMPDALAVELVTVAEGPMEVTVSAEGKTRARNTWTVTAPISGTVSRSPVEVGDKVEQGMTVVAQMRPAEPALLDARSRLAAEAAVTEAEAIVRQSEVQLKQAEVEMDYARTRLARDTGLAAQGTIPQRVLEDSQQAATAAAAALEAARFDLQMHRATLARMQAQLAPAETDASPDRDKGCCVNLTAPHDGTVLSVTEESARLVQAGSPLLTIGDLSDMQIELDLLSSDAVKVAPGAPAHVEGWGGAEALTARVARIDPVGFTRVSALGIEEQRVRLHLDLDQTPPGLGDGFRVFVHVVVWQADKVLQVPQSALFRQGDGWAVFRAVSGRAVATPVTVGHTEETMAEVTSGLAAGDQVIAYPGNRVSDGARIRQLVVN